MAMLASSAVFAGSGSGKIKQIYAHATGDELGLIFIKTENITSAIGCNSAHQFVIKANTEQGKAMYSLALSAAAMGKSVTIVGLGTCELGHKNREDVNYILVNY